MSTIFSHAVNAIKAASRPNLVPFEEPKKVISINGSESIDPASILNRIQPNKKHSKSSKSITIRKNNYDTSSDFDISRIQKKTISKDLNKILRRPTKKPEPEDLYKNEAEVAPVPTTVNKGGIRFFVHLRSLPRGTDEAMLRDIISNNSNIIEFKISNDKVEIEFYTKDGAKQAVDLLNNRIIRGSKIKAELITEFNLTSFNPLLNKVDHYESQEVERPNYYSKEEIREKIQEQSPEKEDPFDEIEADEEEDDNKEEEEKEPEEKPSILSRIKKNR